MKRFKDLREYTTRDGKVIKPYGNRSQQRLQLAIAIALDMGGNMTGAYNRIEKIEKGLGDHPAVKAALRIANESVNEKLSAADKKKRLIMIRKAVEKMRDRELKMAKKDAMAAIKALESVNEGFEGTQKNIRELNGQTGPVLRISYKPQKAGGKLTSHSTITKSDLYNDVIYNKKNWSMTANTNSIEIRLPHAKGDERDRKHFMDLLSGATGNVSNLIRGGGFTKSEVMELKKDYEKAAKAFGADKVVSQDHSIYVSHKVPGKLKVKEGLLAMLKALDEFGMRNHISLNSRNGVLTQIQDAGQYGTNEAVKIDGRRKEFREKIKKLAYEKMKKLMKAQKENWELSEGKMDARERQLNYKLKELEYRMKLKDFANSTIDGKKVEKKEEKKPVKKENKKPYTPRLVTKEGKKRLESIRASIEKLTAKNIESRKDKLLNQMNDSGMFGEDAGDHKHPHKKKGTKEGNGLWANIHKKRKSGKRMRKPGEKGAPTAQDFKNASEQNSDAGVQLKVTDTSSTTFNKLRTIAKDLGVEITREDDHLLVVGDAKKMEEFKAQMSVAMKESVQLQEGMSKQMPIEKYAKKIGINKKEQQWILDNEADMIVYEPNQNKANSFLALSYPVNDGDYYFAFLTTTMDTIKAFSKDFGQGIADVKKSIQLASKSNAQMNKYLKKLVAKNKKHIGDPNLSGYVYNIMNREFDKLPRALGAGDTMTREELASAVEDICKAQIMWEGKLTPNKPQIAESIFASIMNKIRNAGKKFRSKMGRRGKTTMESKKTFKEARMMKRSDVMRKHGRELKKVISPSSNSFDLSDKAEEDLITYVMDNYPEEIPHDDPDVWVEWLHDNLEDFVKGRGYK